MAGSKHDADCLRRRDSERTRYLCTCDLTDEQLAEADKRRSLPDLTERVGRGICDGCGEQGELTAFNAPQVACGICICDACLAKNEETT